jgi:uncharacterized protein (DUF3084 family)
MGSADFGAAGERNTYGNQAGRGLLEDRQDMKERMKRLNDWMAKIDTQMAKMNTQTAKMNTQMAKMDTQMAKMDTQMADHQAQIADLQDRVEILATDVEGYHGIRHRFTDTHRRDVPRNVTEQESIRINEGNIAAHEGDAIIDAMLYITHQRDDEDVLISLYGLTADQIWFLSKCLTS